MSQMDQRPIVVLGSTGQVGRALLKLLGNKGVGLGRPDTDLSDTSKILAQLERIKPSVVINAAAYTQVDKAESEKELAWQINGRAPGELAHWAQLHNIPFVHYSTDYVFADSKAGPWTETDPTGPMNIYGQSKLEGEKQIATQGGKFLIFRTSWVYDSTGKNFLNTMLKLGSERTELRVVADQIGAPTFAADIAEATLKVLDATAHMPNFPSGVYHLTNAGETSWHGFAVAIFEIARKLGFKLALKEVHPIPTKEYPTPASRPKNSRLSNEKLKRTFGLELRPWQDALSDCMHERIKTGS